MRKLPTLAVALMPFVAIASPQGKQGESDAGQAKVEKQKLQQSTPATAILDQEVYSRQGEELGTLQDIVISKDGKVKDLVIAIDMQGNQDTAQQGQQPEEQNARSEQAALQQDRARSDDRRSDRGQGAMPGESQVSVKPDSIQYDARQKRVTMSKEKLTSAERRVYDASERKGELKLSEVVGMDVRLQDEESFGDIEDVMLSKDNSEVVALVVDNWDGLEKNRRALPMQQATIDPAQGEVAFKLNLSDVQQLPDFNLDNYKDDGWDLTDWTD